MPHSRRGEGGVAMMKRHIEPVPFSVPDDWPVDRPGGWLRTVNRPQDGKELDRVRDCVRRGRPYGDEAWTARTAARLGLESTLRSVGRPRKAKEV